MFPIKFTFIFAATFIFVQITDLADIGNTRGSTNFSRANYNSKLVVSTRYTREIGCRIPRYPRHTTYKILSQTNSYYGPLDYVPIYTALETICDVGYKLSPVKQNISLCVDGAWTPSLSNCLEACPSLTSIISTNVKCSHETVPLDNCFDPVEGTTVLLTCNPMYEESSIQYNPVHLCTDGKWEPAIPQCYPICGQKRAEGVVNVINGANIVQGDYPWHIGIYNSSNQDYLCGGALIYPNIVISAAHCFTNTEGVAFSCENYVIAAGKYYRELNDHRDFFSQQVQLKEIKIPDRYKGRTSLQALDIAVLILKEPFVLTIAVQPVCIELNDELLQIQLSSNDNGIVTGWGVTQEGGELSDVLKEVVIPYIPFDQCYNKIPNSFRRYFTQDKICGGYLNSETGVCGGDSGGGYVFHKVTTDRYYIKGVVSTSPTTNELQCDSNQYSLYTSITAHITFVRNVVIYNRLRFYVECKLDKCAKEEIPEVEEVVNFMDDIYARCCPQYSRCDYYACKNYRPLFKRMVDMIL